VKFHNLCGYQAIVTKVDANTLPGPLDGGMSFGNGINVVVLLNGEIVEALPAGAGIDVSFPLSEDPNTVAALLWNQSGGDWIAASQTSAENSFYQVLTTAYTGTIVIVSK
jgi:hypothetical protein